MSKNSKNTNQSATPRHLVGNLRELAESKGWEILEKRLDNIMGKLKDLIWLPCSDETPKFTATHLVKERLAALYLMKSLPRIMLQEAEDLMTLEEQGARPLQDKIKDHDKKFFEEISKYIKIDI